MIGGHGEDSFDLGQKQVGTVVDIVVKFEILQKGEFSWLAEDLLL